MVSVQGRVTDCLSVHQLAKDTSYYLCGGTEMIKDVSTVLESRGVIKENIHFEKFF